MMQIQMQNSTRARRNHICHRVMVQQMTHWGNSNQPFFLIVCVQRKPLGKQIHFTKTTYFQILRFGVLGEADGTRLSTRGDALALRGFGVDWGVATAFRGVVVRGVW